MSAVSLEEAGKRLPELIDSLQPGQEVVLVRDGQAVATLTRAARTSWPCKAGSAEHRPHWMAPDFDAPLEDFREYVG